MRPLVEGVGIALASLRAHKVRAALTILGVAIGVMVVMVIGAMIAGFDKGLSDMLASLGPKTFYVGRFWGGAQQEDPDDPNPWRRRPAITITEATRRATTRARSTSRGSSCWTRTGRLTSSSPGKRCRR